MLNILQLTQLGLFAMDPVFKLGVLFTISVCCTVDTFKLQTLSSA